MSEQTPANKQQVGRRRRANVAGGRHHSHEVKVSAEEEARLLALAYEQRVSVPRLLIESTLAGGVGETPTRRRAAMSELFGIRRDLAGVANNVNQIARAANTDGRMPVGTAAALENVRLVVDRIDTAIDGLSRP